MKKKILVGIALCFLLTGCGQFTIHGKNIVLDQTVDFRHVTYQTSTNFDYGSDGEYRYYNLYDKDQNVLYSVTIEKKKGTYKEDLNKVKKNKKNKNIKTEDFSKNKVQWTKVSYKVEDMVHHLYYATYDKDEYYRVEFINVIDSTEKFEDTFISKMKFQ